MSRQADALLEQIGGRRRRRPGPSSVVAVAAGRGGIGVSLVAAAIALRSASAGRRTLLVDADPWLEVQRLWLGLGAGPRLDTLRTGSEPESLVVPVSATFALVSLGSEDGVREDMRHLVRRVPRIFEEREAVVVDAGSGLDALERAVDLNAGSLLLVTSADPVGLAATHALLKAASAVSQMPVWVIFNMAVASRAEAGRAALADGGRRYLGFEPRVLAPLPVDPELGRALGDGALLAESLARSALVPRVDGLVSTLFPREART